MKFIVAATALCVATVAITSADAAKPAKEGEKKASTSRILRKLPTKGEAVRVNNSNNKAEDKVLAEDEGYWERFLQNEVPSITDPPTPSPTPPPTPSPTGTCDVKVSKESSHHTQTVPKLLTCSTLSSHIYFTSFSLFIRII